MNCDVSIMSANPAFQILSSTKLFLSKSPTISTKTTADELGKALEDVDGVLARFEQLCACLNVDTKAEPNELAEDKKALLNICAHAGGEIFMSFIDQKVVDLLGKSNLNASMPIDDLKTALKDLIGEVDQMERQRQLKNEMGQMTRRVDSNEKFTTFLDRLKRHAAKITSTTYADELVSDQWMKDLRKMDLDLLELFPDAVAGKTGLELVKINAKLLDDRKFFKKVEVSSNQVQIDSVRAALEAKVDQLAFQLEQSQVREQEYRQRQEQFEMQLLARIDRQTEQSDQLKVHLMNSTKTENKAEKVTPKPPKEPSTSSTAKLTKKPWMDRANYCYYCGSRRCRKGSACEGNPSLYCMHCEAYGHAVTSGHFHQKGSKNSN